MGKRAAVVIIVLLLSALSGVAVAAVGDQPYPIEIGLLPSLLQLVAFGLAAPGLAYLAVDWIKVKVPKISPYMTRNAAIALSGVFGIAAWLALILIGEVDPPPPDVGSWLRYAVSILGTCGTLNQLLHGAVKLDKVREEAPA